MNELTYVAVEMSRTEKFPELRFGESARVYIGDEWKFSVQVQDKWNSMIYVVMFTSLRPANVVGFHVLHTQLHDTLNTMAQLVTAPF